MCLCVKNDSLSRGQLSDLGPNANTGNGALHTCPFKPFLFLFVLKIALAADFFHCTAELICCKGFCEPSCVSSLRGEIIVVNVAQVRRHNKDTVYS